MLGKPKLNRRIALCVGLWLGDGDNQTKSEIAFTNNNTDLIKLFKKIIGQLFNAKNVRIYVYSNERLRIPKIKFNCKVNFYIDKRARKPYYIFRLASVELNQIWKDIVKNSCNCEEFYPAILQGFFAAEGSIKTGKRSERVVRISQGKENKFIEKILDYFKLHYIFDKRARSYEITRKESWDTLANIDIARLYYDKHKKFWNAYNSFKQEHYPKFYLKNKLLELLNQPKTSKELAIETNRSHSRISELLGILKKENKVKNFRVRSKDYWTKESNLIIISKIKENYLNYLNNQMMTILDLANVFNIEPCSVRKNLHQLKRLGLVDKNINGKWYIKILKDKRIMIK